MQRSEILEQKNLQAAFNLFDSDGSGKISKYEIMEIMGFASKGTNDEELIQNMIKQVDQDKDGKIDFEEFK